MARKRIKDKDEPVEQDVAKTTTEETPDEFDDPQYLIDYVKNCKKEAEEACSERRSRWRELWQLFQNKQDYTNKQTWQSKAFLPKIFMHCYRAASLVEKAILQTSTLFKVEIDRDKYEEAEYEEAQKKARKVEAKLKSHLENTNFAEAYGEGIGSTFLLGFGVKKRTWGEEKIIYENVDVFNIHISPHYKPFVDERPRYIIEEQEEDLADLLDKIKGNEKVYDMDAVEKIQSDAAAKAEIKEQEKQRRGLGEFAPQNKKVQKLLFWGDIVSKDGKRILKNRLLIVANESQLIRNHENPFKDGLPPYRFTVPLPYPHRGIAGISLVEGAVPLQYTLNNLLNLYMDNLNFTVNKMFEVDKSNLTEPEKAKRIYPGKMWLKNSGSPAVSEVNVTALGTEVVTALKVVDSELRQATAISEYVEALPSGRQQTLGEIEKKTSEAHGFFDVIARRLERNSISPLIKDSYNLLLQFSDTLKGLEGHYIFKVGGLTILLEEEKLKQSMDMILMAAMKNQMLGQLTDIPTLWKKYLTHFNLGEVYKEPTEQPGKTIVDAEAKAKQDIASLPDTEKIKLLQAMPAAPTAA